MREGLYPTVAGNERGLYAAVAGNEGGLYPAVAGNEGGLYPAVESTLPLLTESPFFKLKTHPIFINGKTTSNEPEIIIAEQVKNNHNKGSWGNGSKFTFFSFCTW